MGKRSGITKSGRVMNPADKERKQMRQKELKRNKKQRVIVRNAIVKSRNPEDLLEQMRRLDDQEFDPRNELPLNVVAEKRSKIRGAFIQIISLYRQEKDEKRVKSLEKTLHEYEIERCRKEQNYKAIEFSQTVDPLEIPLPIGSMNPEAARTPFYAVPVLPIIPSTQPKFGILKRSVKIDSSLVRKQKYPPGPPCGCLYNIEDDNSNKESDRHKHVRFNNDLENDDDDLAPVEMPDNMIIDKVNFEPSIPPHIHHIGVHMSQGYNQIPLSIPMEAHVHNHMFRPRVHLSYSEQARRETNYSAIISAEPQVVKPSADSSSVTTVISAGPQMRNLKKETTRFVPSTLQVQRPQPSIGPKLHPVGPQTVIVKKRTQVSRANNFTKSVDEACDDFLKELEGLI